MPRIDKLPWELRPLDDDADDDATFYIHRERYRADDPEHVALSSTSDPYEHIYLGTTNHIDKLINHLKQAREWLKSQESTN